MATYPQVNATTFANMMKGAFDANPSPQTALLINGALLDLIKRIRAQAQLVAAPNSVRLAAGRLQERIEGGRDTLINVITYAYEDPATRQKEFQESVAQLFTGYPYGSSIEDEAGTYSTEKLRGDAFEVATLWNQVGAIDNPLNAQFFENGIANAMASAMVQAVVAVGEQIGQSEALSEAAASWNQWTTKMAAATDELIKKALSPWLWAVAGAAAFWLWANRDKVKE